MFSTVIESLLICVRRSAGCPTPANERNPVCGSSFPTVSTDKAFVVNVVNLLPDFVERWIDEEQLWVGMDLEQSIRGEIDSEVDLLVAFLSQAALHSGWVERELTWALEREAAVGRNFVLPILMEDIDDQLPRSPSRATPAALQRPIQSRTAVSR